MTWVSRTRNITIGNDEGLLTQTTTTTRGCIQSTVPLTSSHTHVIVCNSEACTNQVATDTRRQLLQAPVALHTGISLAQNPPQINTSTAQREGQQPSMRLRIQRDLEIGDCCYAKYFEDGLFYSAKIVDIHHSGETAVVKFDEYDVPEEVLADDILPESPSTRRRNPVQQPEQLDSLPSYDRPTVPSSIHSRPTQSVRFDSLEKPPLTQPSSRENPTHDLRFNPRATPHVTQSSTREQNFQKKPQSNDKTMAEEIAIQLQKVIQPLVGAIEVFQRENVRSNRPEKYAGSAPPDRIYQHPSISQPRPESRKLQHPLYPSHTTTNALNENHNLNRSALSAHDTQVDDRSLKANKAFKLILAAKANLFDGSDRGQYQEWKEALEREVYGLSLTPAQWMDLIHARTTKEANAAIQPARLLQRETSPEEALDIAWQFLDKRFSTSQMPSQQLLDDSLHGPIITSSSVTEFAHQCQAAVLLRRSHPGSLTSLDELTTQKNLFNRLNDDLHLKWYEYKCTHLQKTPTFEEFSRWIDAQSEIHLERQDHLSKHQTSTWQTTPSSGYKVQASPNQSRRANKPSVTRTPIGSNPSQN